MQRASSTIRTRRNAVDAALARLAGAALAAVAVSAGLAIGGCGHGHAAGPGTGAPGSGVRDFPLAPAGDLPPPIPELAARLASGLPDADRAAARRLLVDDILSRDLRDLPSAPTAQPSAGAIVRAAYGTLVAVLGRVPRAQRLPRLITIACTRRGDRVTRRAAALAVARYVADRGRPGTHLVVGYLDEAQPYLDMTAEALQAEADRIDRDLTDYERDAQSDRACHDQQRRPLAQARRAVAAARTGAFDPATGPFYVFLRNAGAKPRRLDPE
jgi:hypothetical protein